jgi:hypothetical protein
MRRGWYVANGRSRKAVTRCLRTFGPSRTDAKEKPQSGVRSGLTNPPLTGQPIALASFNRIVLGLAVAQLIAS